MEGAAVMSKPTFTPGPWSLWDDRDLNGRIAVVDAYRTTVVDMEFPVIDDERAGATARLIAAAPDLYDALVQLVEMGKHEGPCDNVGDVAGQACVKHLSTAHVRERRARAALGKARGDEA